MADNTDTGVTPIVFDDLDNLDDDSLGEGLPLEEDDNEEELNEEENNEEADDEEEESKDDDDSSEEKGEEKEDEENEEDEQDEEEEDEDLGIFAQVSERLGIELEFEGESEDPIENFVAYSQKAINTLVDQKVDSYKNSNPVTKDFLDYLENGGDPNKFIEVLNPEINYLDIKSIKKDEDLQRRLVLKDLLDKEVSKKDALDMVDSYLASNILEKQAEIALAVGKREQEQQLESLVEQQNKQREQLEEAYAEEADRFTRIVQSSSNIKGLPIPEAEKDDFISFITRDKNGVSPYLLKTQEGFTDEQYLTIQRLVHMDFDLSKLVKSSVRQSKADSLKSMLESSKKKESSSRKQKETKGDIDNIKLE